MSKFNFDEIIPREKTNSINYEGYTGWLLPSDVKLDYPKETMIRLWVADMDFAAPAVVIDAIKARLDKRIFGYTKVFDPQYYDSFAKWNEDRYGWNFPREHLVTSPGIIPALYQMPDLMMASGEKILILTPSYAPFKSAGDYQGREVVYSRLIEEDGRYSIDFKDLQTKAADAKTTLCIFCNPHNPTGRVWTQTELEKFSSIMKKEKMWVISDEIHCDLLRTGIRHTPLAKVMGNYDRLVTCMAPSKTFNLAGLMISNLIIPNEKLREKWAKRNLVGDNPLSIAGAQAAYSQGGPWLEELQIYLDDNFIFLREYLAKHLPKARFRIPEATYLAWVDLTGYLPKDPGSITLYFAKGAGVILEDGSMFVDNGDGFVRLNLACPQSVLAEGLDRMAGLLNQPDANLMMPTGLLGKLKRKIKGFFPGAKAN